MPPVIAFAIAAIAIAPVAAGLVTGLTIFGASVASILVGLSISFALQGLAGLLLGGPASNTPAEQRQNIRQPVAPRSYVVGRAKVGGVYAFLNDKASYLHQVIMTGQGEIDAFEQHYLGSDQLTLASDPLGQHATAPARFVWKGGTYVTLDIRTGLDNQTAFAGLIAAWSGTVDSNFRLLGIACVWMKLLSPPAADFSQVWPSGLEQYNAVVRGAKVWDPRDPAQDPLDRTTWQWRENGALIALFYAIHSDGMRLPLAMVQAAIAIWKTAADKCDALRDLAAGGTEAWYRLGGTYKLSDPPKVTLPLMLQPMDGRLGLLPSGGIGIDVGEWQDPILIIADTMIVSYSLSRGRQAQDIRNEIRAQYVAPENDFIAQEADPWRNDTSINVDGLQSVMLDLSMCPSHPQARYRMKIEAARNDSARWNGQVVTKAYGLKFLSQRADGRRQRTVRFIIEELGLDETFEVQRFAPDLRSGICTFSVTQMGPADFTWDAATEEGQAPTPASTPAAGTVETPSDILADVEDITISGGVVAKHIVAAVPPAVQDSLTLVLQYRTHNAAITDAAAAWTAFIYDGLVSGHTNPLADGVYDVRAAWESPQGGIGGYLYARNLTVGYGGTPSTPGSISGAAS